MVLQPRSTGTIALRLIVGLALMGWPRVGAAQGTWSVIAVPQQLDADTYPTALAVDTAGNLYVAALGSYRIQQRDAQGHWSVVEGPYDIAMALAADAAGNLYILDYSGSDRIQKRDSQGNWSVIARAITNFLTPVGQVYSPEALAVDAEGSLYVADYVPNLGGGPKAPLILKRDTQGNWSVIASQSGAGLAVDAAGNLFLAEYNPYHPELLSRIQERDAQGIWSVIATYGHAPGQVYDPRALAADTAGNLYVAENDSRIQKRDAQGNWSVIAAFGTALGQVSDPMALAMDGLGNLYVADTGNNRVQMYTPGP